VSLSGNTSTAMKLEGRAALVTGASKGIGAGLAIGLAQAGARVAVHYGLDKAGAERTLTSIREHGGDGEIFQANIGKKNEVEDLVETVHAQFGRLDVLVNNAARTRFAPALDATEDDLDEVLDTIIRGPFFGSVAAARYMMKESGGSIINITSAVATLAKEFHAVYAVAKGGLEVMTRQLAYEFAPKVRVNAIAPGATSNERNLGYDPDFDQKYAQIIPMGRVLYPEDHVGPCVFLASDDSGFLTGEVLHVDGGYSLYGHSPGMSGWDFSRERNHAVVPSPEATAKA
jgi:3-oxoacyl-[acyl-carrier protein] reductase